MSNCTMGLFFEDAFPSRSQLCNLIFLYNSQQKSVNVPIKQFDATPTNLKMPQHWFPAKWQKFHTDDVSLPTSGSASDWLKQILENFPRQSTNQRHYSDLCGEAVCVVTRRMEFLRSFLRRHFLEVASRNVGCFLRPLAFSS